MIQDIDEWLKDNGSNKTIYNRNLTPNQREFPKTFPMEETEYEEEYDEDEWGDEEE